MRIARLELYGFKSFPDRTTFEFGPGVSCVVGPNGSGKSNVVDAIRWCIGEQSAKSLRGSEMMDVIFAGSADRAPVGFAEVRLTFSSDTGEPFPGEYAQLVELMVGRRLHRNGTSEYLINGVKCRRKDILDLFLDTGVGSNLYSFIAQGQVEKIVHASPQNRRTILDEAAGISRYAARRAEAQQRLEATGSQLDRAADVTDEMERRLKVLERQVVRAAEFRRVRALIRQEEIFLSLVRYRELAADRRALREDHRKTENEAAANRRELARRQNDLTQRREELAVVEAAAAKWRDEVAELDARSRELESTRGFQLQRASELEEQAILQRAEVDSATETIERERVAARQALASAEEVQGRMGDGAEAAKARTQAAEKARNARIEARSAVDTCERQLAEAEAAVTRAGDRLGAIDGLEREARVQGSRARESADRADRELERRGLALTAVSQSTQAALDAVSRAQRSRDEVLALAEAAAARTREADERVAGLEQELDGAREALDERVEEAAQRAEERRRNAEEALLQTQRDAAQRFDEARERGRESVDRVRSTYAERVRKIERLRMERLEIEAERTRLEGEIQQLESERASLLAAAAIEGIEDGRSLVERLGLEGPEAREWAARVGDRLLLPVVESAAEAVRVAGAIGEGEVRLLLAPDGDPRPAWERAWTGFETVDEVVQHYLRTGGGAFGPGVRVDADGVLHLGSGSAADRMSRLSNLEKALDQAAVDLEAFSLDLSANRTRVEAVVGGPLDGEVIDGALRQTRREEERDLSGAEQAAADGLNDARQEGESAVDRCRVAVTEAIESVAGARDEARLEGERVVAEVRTRVLTARQDREVARKSQESAAGEARIATQAANAAELAGTRAEGELRLAESAVREAEASLEAHTARVVEIDEQLSRAATERAEQIEARSAASAEVERLRVAVLPLRLALEQAEELEREAAAEVGAYQARADALRERHLGLLEQADAAETRATEALDRQARAKKQADELAAASVQARRESVEAGKTHATVSDARSQAWDKLQRERTRIGKLKEALQKAEADGDQLQEKARAHAARVAELEAAVNQAKGELEVLRGNMDDRYQVSLPGLMDRAWAGPVVLEAPPEVREVFDAGSRTIEAVEDFHFTRQTLEDAGRIAEVVTANQAHRAILAKLGEVNLGALDEFGELQLRYDELVTQRGDLESSVADIRRAIAKMNRTCRQRFRDAFDRVNEFFQEVYPRLVGGGSARLSLTDEEDLLETGVEIYVQPPGKRLQNLTLLSGGEKAMTAIALLIAIFKVKPSPFCVLDEVDAPLDEANGSRFNDIIREMSAVSQFLVITHNRKTMECADTLYGVTMGRPGVSKLVSVNLAV